MHLIANFGPEKYCSVFYKSHDEAQQTNVLLQWMGHTKHFDGGVFQAYDGLGERNSEGGVVVGVAEERTLGQREVEPQSLDVWRRTAQSGEEILLQTGSYLDQDKACTG